MKYNNSIFNMLEKRGTVKEHMSLRRIRTINFWNYLKWKGFNPEIFPVKSVKLDILNGYLNLYDSTNHKIPSEEARNLYNQVYDLCMEIFRDEKLIPCKQRKNIVVSVNR